MTAVRTEQIIQACSVLFGEDFAVEKETLDYLQVSGIKQAFRSRVKECHPDTSGYKDTGGVPEKFLELKDAYDFLVSVKSERAGGSEKSGGETRSNSEASGVLPKRKLRLGEFLYYTGRISWNELISAITWQRKTRRDAGRNCLIGNYFTRFSIINSSDMGLAVFKLNIHNSRYQKSSYQNSRY